MQLKKIYSIYLEDDPGFKKRLGFSHDEDVANSVAEDLQGDTVIVPQHVTYDQGIATMYVVKELEPLNSMHAKTISDVQDRVASNAIKNLSSIEIKALENKGMLNVK